MAHARPRHVDRAQPAGRQLQAQVGILVVGGRVVVLEPARGEERGPVDQEAGGGAEVHDARERELGVIRRAAVAVLDHAAVGGQQRPRALHPAVELEHARTGRPDAAGGIDGVDERLEPARLHERVRVEEADER